MSEEKQIQDKPAQETVTQGNGPQESVPAQDNSVGEHMTGGKPRKMKLGVQVAIAVAALLLVGIVGFAAGKIYKAVEKANMNPTEYYRYVVKKSREESLKTVKQSYDANLQAVSGEQANRELAMTVRVSDTAKSLMSLSGLDFSGFDNLGLNMVYGVKGDDALTSLILKVNDEDLLTGKISVNAKENKAFAQIPELSSSYLDFSKSLSKLREDSANNMIFSLTKQQEAMPTADELEKWIISYSDIFMENAKDVEKKKETSVKVEDIAQKAVTYVFTMNNDKLIKMLGQYLKEMQQDKVMKKLLESVDKQSYASFQEELEKAQADLSSAFSKENAGEIKAVVETQISNDDRIVGEKITLENDGEEIGNLIVNCPKAGKKFGVEIVLQAQGKDLMRIVGSGTNESGVLNGEFKAGVDSSLLEGSNLVNTDKLLTIKLTDYDLSQLAKGKVKGSCTLSTSAVAALANCSLVVEQEGSQDNMKQKVKVMMGKDTLVTFDITSKGNAKLPEVAPGDGDKIYDADSAGDMLAYENELKIADVLKKLQEKTGINISSLLDLDSLGDEGFTDPGDAMVGDEDVFGDLSY